MKDGRLHLLCFSRFMIRGWQATAIPYTQDESAQNAHSFRIYLRNDSRVGVASSINRFYIGRRSWPPTLSRLIRKNATSA